MRGYIGGWVILLLLAASVYYWRITLPIIAVIVAAAVVGGRNTRVQAREDEFAAKKAALEAAHQWAVDRIAADANKEGHRRIAGPGAAGEAP
jgi:hypothetical protein